MQALRKAFDFQHYLILTRVYRDDEAESNAPASGAAAAAAGGSAGASVRVAKRAKGGAAAGARLVYTKPEDAAFHERSLWSFSFPAAVTEPSAVADRAAALTQMRLVMCVEAAAVRSSDFLQLGAAKATQSEQGAARG